MMTSLDAPVEYEITSPETASTPAAPPQPAIANNTLINIDENGGRAAFDINVVIKDANGNALGNTEVLCLPEGGSARVYKTDCNGVIRGIESKQTVSKVSFKLQKSKKWLLKGE